jgi:membrane protease YdiL (CAAX protease family)
VINAVFEELTVTAYVIESMASGGAGPAIAASTLLRFSYYLWQGPLASLSMVPLGLLFGMMYWRRRNVWPLIVAHTIANAVVFALHA